MTVRLLRAADVRRACSMTEAIDAVATGFAALSTGRATVPVRLAVPLVADGVALAMPAALAGASFYSMKLVSIAPANTAAGRPLLSATVLLGDAITGELLALLDGTALTALRTGAAGGLAARLLSRDDSRVAALFGAGTQARTQLTALVAVRSIRELRVVTREAGHADALRAWCVAQPELARIAVATAGPEAAVEGADVVVTATTSRTPVFPGASLSGGAHVTAVGSFTPETRELDAETLRGARVFVDQRAASLAEAGELTGLAPDGVVELGEVVAGLAPGRTDRSERTVFKSVGNAIQDLVVAARAYERSRELGIGQDIDFP